MLQAQPTGGVLRKPKDFALPTGQMTDTSPEMPPERIESGLADVVIFSADEQLPIPSHLIHPNLDHRQITKIARNMVIGAMQPEVILRSEGISDEQFQRYVRHSELYKRVYDTFLLEWQSPLSTNKRIAILSAILLEDGLMDLALRMVNADTPFNSAIEAAKALAKFAGIGESTGQQSLAPSERFTINIITSQTSERLEVQQVTEGKSAHPPILLEPHREDPKA